MTINNQNIRDCLTIKIKNYLSYERVTRSLLLIIIKATPITRTTKLPATKLEIKFANEVVIFKFPLN